MLSGFLRVGVVSPTINVCDIKKNVINIFDSIKKANESKIKILVFPELSITGCTAEAMFKQDTIINASLDALFNIVHFSIDYDIVLCISMPFLYKNKLYDIAAIILKGEILGFIPKNALLFDKDLGHDRIFSCGRDIDDYIEIYDDVNQKVHKFFFSNNIYFKCKNDENIKFFVEVGNDNKLEITKSPIFHYANFVLNPSISEERVYYNNNEFDEILLKSKKYSLAYISSGANIGESTSKNVYFANSVIIELGEIIKKQNLLNNQILISDIDYEKIAHEKLNNYYFEYEKYNKELHEIEFEFESLGIEEYNEKLNRYINPLPFLPKNEDIEKEFAYKILNIQAIGLSKRMNFLRCEHAILGLSGGLDSTLALLATIRAFDILGINKSGIHIINMPSSNTSNKTNNNAKILSKIFNLEYKEINISESIIKHFEDINHDINNINVTFENAQARERTQILFDIANDYNGLVIGTGDLSESALGFCTYNGDNMSSYNPNASIPKTLIRYMFSSFINDYSKKEETKELANVLSDILNTPISPELLPLDKTGCISQKTEEIIGPYVLHDFFLYYYLKNNYSPKKIYELALYTFLQQDEVEPYKFDKNIILNTLKIFFKRFINNAYKRNTGADGPSIGLPNLDTHTNYFIPSDISIEEFLNDIEKIC
ncbi:MAG: NAD(+) synthase [Eubacteriales bacterium]|nr:NAD(+) synthase [Eubacteriales bacterium]